MAAINLPTVAIDSADVPRLRAAIRSTYTGTTAEMDAMTDGQLYKWWVIRNLREVVRTYEAQQMLLTVYVGMAEPPTMT